MRSARLFRGSASIQELEYHVARKMALTDEQLAVIHGDREDLTEVAYRMAWARTYLKSAGFINNSTRGVWTLTPKGRDAAAVDVEAIAEEVRTKTKGLGRKRRPERSADDEVNEAEDWKDDVLHALGEMRSDAFERLCQRLLRECGFEQVEVTGRTGDGGIDGVGVLRLEKLLTFRIVFQCKRWRGTVGAPQVRDFRGAMSGRTDKGLLITTGRFSGDAKDEAVRAGATPIDLIDGRALAELLKERELGVKKKKIEQITVDRDWFASF